ncbi:AAA family ATPase [Blastococcus sp. SYSU DS0753]
MSALRQYPFSVIVSLLWDDRFERDFSTAETLVLTPADKIPAPSKIAQYRRLVLKPWGDNKAPDSIGLSFADFERRVGRSAEFSELLSSVLSTNIGLFVGLSGFDIDEMLRVLAFSSNTTEFSHYALLGRSRHEATYRKLLSAKYGLEWLDLPGSSLAARISNLVRRLGRPMQTSYSRAPSLREDPLRRVRLRGIGIFPDLTIDLSPSWTILLGDNSAGKTTVLRAIALALSDRSGRSSDAERLLSSQSKAGEIELTIGKTRYVTRLIRERQGVVVESSGPTPVQTGELLTLGFSSLRTSRILRPSGAADDFGRDAPDDSDMSSLRRGVPDTRVNDLAQWLTNLAVRAEGGEAFGDAALAQRHLSAIFDLWRDLTPGLDIRYAGIDPEGWSLLVRTRSGVVPLDSLSQGTLSTVSWVGTLFRRLIEVTGGEGLPPEAIRRSHALVLIDELDAHLHPQWQRVIVPRVRAIFPKVQFIATTHSPLIVGSMRPGEIVRLRRNEDGVVTAVHLPDYQGWRADQILTDLAFELAESRDVSTANRIEEYKSLLARSPKLTSEESGRLVRLEAELGERVPRVAESAIRREAAELLEIALREKVGRLTPEQKAALVSEAASILADVREGV